MAGRIRSKVHNETSKRYLDADDLIMSFTDDYMNNRGANQTGQEVLKAVIESLKLLNEGKGIQLQYLYLQDLLKRKEHDTDNL